MSRLTALMLALIATGALADRPRDPTAPPGAGTGAAGETALRLSATQVNAADRRAVINGTSVREGDRVAGATVLRIERNRVHLRRGGREMVLELHGQSFRKAGTEISADE